MSYILYLWLRENYLKIFNRIEVYACICFLSNSVTRTECTCLCVCVCARARVCVCCFNIWYELSNSREITQSCPFARTTTISATKVVSWLLKFLEAIQEIQEKSFIRIYRELGDLHHFDYYLWGRGGTFVRMLFSFFVFLQFSVCVPTYALVFCPLKSILDWILCALTHFIVPI